MSWIRFWRPKSKRCQKCNAIVPYQDSHCYKCGGKKFQ